MSEIETRAEEDEPRSPYSNLLVPLVVVPALIVIVLVLVFVLFGAIAGKASTPEENLKTMLEGGANEREQAAFQLVRQVEEYSLDRYEGRDPEFPIDDSFLPRLRDAWEVSREEDAQSRYVIASLLVRLGDPDAVGKLIGLLATPERFDPEGQIRFSVINSLGLLGASAPAEQRDLIRDAVLPFLELEDHGLRLVTAAALQNLPGPATTEALRGLLSSPSVELRGQGAISLSHLGQPDGAEVLIDLIEAEPYEAARRQDSSKFRRQQLVMDARVKAVLALARLGRPQDRELLERLAGENTDIPLREAAMRALAESPGAR